MLGIFDGTSRAAPRDDVGFIAVVPPDSCRLAATPKSADFGPFPDLRFRLLVTDYCVIPMHEREQEQHPGTNQYRGHCCGINARQ
jgi:hypothetical protein